MVFQPSEQRRPQLDLAVVPPTHPLEVVGRDPPVAVEGARNLAGDGPRGVRVAQMVHSLEQRTVEVGGPEARVQRDGERVEAERPKVVG